MQNKTLSKNKSTEIKLTELNKIKTIIQMWSQTFTK